MKKFMAIAASLLLVGSFSTPAQSAGTLLYQKTLASYSGSNTSLSGLQKTQIERALSEVPDAEKFICTGIRYYDQPMSVNIMVRKRAKAACEYAKQLNPNLSTWYQNKPTKARSYAGKVLLTIKSKNLRSPEKVLEIPLFEGALSSPEFSSTVVGEVALFDEGVWPNGWKVSSTEFFACSDIFSKGNWSLLFDNTAYCEPLQKSFFDAIPIPERYSGKYLSARLKLRYLDYAPSEREYSVGGRQVGEGPIWPRQPQLTGSSIVGQEVSLDLGESDGYVPSGYEVLRLSSIWACPAGSATEALMTFEVLLADQKCDWLGDMDTNIAIPESALGKYLVGNARIRSRATGRILSQTTWRAWEVRPSSSSSVDPSPAPESTPSPTPLPDTTPEEEPELTLKFTKAFFIDGVGSCNEVANGSGEYFFGEAVIQKPDWQGLRTWVYRASFKQIGNGGYSFNGTRQLWGRELRAPGLFGPWSNITSEVYPPLRSIPWRAPIELTCMYYR